MGIKSKRMRWAGHVARMGEERGTLHADRYAFLIKTRSVLLTLRNVSEQSCRENQNTHFVVSNFFPKIVRAMR